MASALATHRNPDDFGTANEFRRFPQSSWASAGASASASPSVFPGRPVNTWMSGAANFPNQHFDDEPSVASSASAFIPANNLSGRPGSARPPNVSNSWTSATTTSDGWVDREDGVIGEIWQPGGAHVPINSNQPDLWASAAANSWGDQGNGFVEEIGQPAWSAPGRPGRPGRPVGVHPPNSSIAVSANATLPSNAVPEVMPSKAPGSSVAPTGVGEYCDYSISDVTFDLSRGRVLSSQPTVLSVQRVKNGTGIVQHSEVSFTKSVTHTSHFDDSAGVSITAGVKFEVGLPFVATGETNLSITGSYTHTWGEAYSTTQEWSARFLVDVSPHSTFRAVSSVTTGTLQVPYVMTVVKTCAPIGSKTATPCPGLYPGATTTYRIGGMWSGVTSWELYHEITDETTGKVVATF